LKVLIAMQEAENTVWVAPTGFSTVSAVSLETKGRMERQRIESENRIASSSGFGSCLVACYNPVDGEFLKKFTNSFSAGKSMGLSIEKIDTALKSKQKVYAGLKWCYLERSDACNMYDKNLSYIQKLLFNAALVARNASTDQPQSIISDIAGWCFSIEDDPFRLIGLHVLR
jgi:hypothetical protein